MIWEDLAALDRLILEGLNGSDSVLVDRLAMLLTSGLTWIPLYLALLYLVIKNNETMAQILLVVCCAGLCLLLAGSIDGGIVKPLVARPRPALDPVMKYSVPRASASSLPTRPTPCRWLCSSVCWCATGCSSPS